MLEPLDSATAWTAIAAAELALDHAAAAPAPEDAALADAYLALMAQLAPARLEACASGVQRAAADCLEDVRRRCPESVVDALMAVGASDADVAPLGASLLAAERWPVARRLYHALAARTPTDRGLRARMHLARGHEELLRGGQRAARRELARAIVLDPTLDAARIALASSQTLVSRLLRLLRAA